MRNLSFFALFFIALLFGCAKTSECVVENNTSKLTGYSATKSIPADAIYDESSGFYLVPNEDVYELSKVQVLYEKLTNNTDKLLPTHRALRILPLDESTAHRILVDSTIWVSRIPFGFRPVAQNIYSEPNRIRHQEREHIFDDCGACDGTGLGTPPEITPLYVRWPVDRIIPSTVTYEVLYDIYTPSLSSAKDSLLSRALAPNIQTRGVRPDAGNHPAWMDPWSLKIMFEDKTLNTYKKAANIHVHYYDYYTYYSRTLVTNTNGKVFVPEDVPMLAVVYLEFYTNDFKITDDNSTNFHVEFVDCVDNLCDYPYSFEIGSPVTTLNYEYSFKRQVFQAARYYYKGNNDLLNNIDKLHLDDPLRIATYQDSLELHHNGKSGIGWYLRSSNPPYIEIANHDTLSRSSFTFDTVLHELGHASHHAELGTLYSSVVSRIKESFASFMGWYNVKQYYSSVLSTDYQIHNACYDGRQKWPIYNIDYTPIYVDLVDNYNQYISNPSYVEDVISGVPVIDVLSFAIGPTTWAQSVALMQQQAGILYSSADLADLIALY